MTPKEKAEELMVQYNNYLQSEISCIVYVRQSAKCAIIAVDEILNVCNCEIQNCSDKTYFYWQEVKQKLQNMQ